MDKSVTDDEKAIKRAEGDRRNGEEVHRGNRFPVIRYVTDFKVDQSFGEPQPVTGEVLVR
jgi:hypothetical protein